MFYVKFYVDFCFKFYVKLCAWVAARVLEFSLDSVAAGVLSGAGFVGKDASDVLVSYLYCRSAEQVFVFANGGRGVWSPEGYLFVFSDALLAAKTIPFYFLFFVADAALIIFFVF